MKNYNVVMLFIDGVKVATSKFTTQKGNIFKNIEVAKNSFKNSSNGLFSEQLKNVIDQSVTYKICNPNNNEWIAFY